MDQRVLWVLKPPFQEQGTDLQWNLSITTTLGPESVWYTEKFGILKFDSKTRDNLELKYLMLASNYNKVIEYSKFNFLPRCPDK